MNPSFKAQVERDIQKVFHNSAEHADIVEFWLDGIRYEGAVILDSIEVRDRKRSSTDYAEGISIIDVVMYAPLALLGDIPRRGLRVEIGDNLYHIAEAHPEDGDIVIYLERYAE